MRSWPHVQGIGASRFDRIHLRTGRHFADRLSIVASAPTDCWSNLEWLPLNGLGHSVEIQAERARMRRRL